jgi:hypothetical protein
MEGAVTLFDLLFILAALASIVTLVFFVVSVVLGKGRRALKIAAGFALCAAVYVAFGLAVSYFRPRRAIAMGEPWCFDDWCLTVEGAERTAAQPDDTYRVDLRYFSTAARVSQRANGAWIYLIDERGRRYSPQADPSEIPLDRMLQPKESVSTTRTFRVPADARNLRLITGHGGGYCGAMYLLIIGEAGCVFGKPVSVTITPSHQTTNRSERSALE